MQGACPPEPGCLAVCTTSGLPSPSLDVDTASSHPSTFPSSHSSPPTSTSMTSTQHCLRSAASEPAEEWLSTPDLPSTTCTSPQPPATSPTTSAPSWPATALISEPSSDLVALPQTCCVPPIVSNQRILSGGVDEAFRVSFAASASHPAMSRGLQDSRPPAGVRHTARESCDVPTSQPTTTISAQGSETAPPTPSTSPSTTSFLQADAAFESIMTEEGEVFGVKGPQKISTRSSQFGQGPNKKGALINVIHMTTSHP